MERITVGSKVSNFNDADMGTITARYVDNNRLVLEVDNSYEIVVNRAKEVIDLVYGTHHFRVE